MKMYELLSLLNIVYPNNPTPKHVTLNLTEWLIAGSSAKLGTNLGHSVSSNTHQFKLNCDRISGADLGEDLGFNLGLGYGSNPSVDLGFDLDLDLDIYLGINLVSNLGSNHGSDFGIDLGVDLGSDLGSDLVFKFWGWYYLVE